jgi:hypothetical protein
MAHAIWFAYLGQQVGKYTSVMTEYDTLTDNWRFSS